MKLLAAFVSRALDAIDIVFDAGGALFRVVLRGAFAPDARSYRGRRFHPLTPSDVLVQEIELNVADEREARKAVALDAERLMPLDQDTVTFDVAGPIETDGRPRARPERRFLLGVARKDALERARTGLSGSRRGAVEGFVYAPPAHAGAAFVFGDEVGRKRRRLRRAALAVALLLLGFALHDGARSGEAALERMAADADAQRLAVERRIRLAERRLGASDAARAALGESQALPIGALSARLNRIALHLPADTELDALRLENGALSFEGRAHAPDAAELALRRAFEGETIVFAVETEEAPQGFSARLAAPPGRAP